MNYGRPNSTANVGIFLVIAGAFFCFGAFALLFALTDGLIDGLGDDAAAEEQFCPELVSIDEDGQVRVLVLSSNTKELWLREMETQFNEGDFQTTDGKDIVVQVWHAGSNLREEEMECEPVAWSPSDQIRVNGVNQSWRDLNNGQSLVEASCPSTVNIPIGIAMWEPMAQALGWPDADISWDDIIALATAEDGWGSVGHPEWGEFRYGHGHPAFSTSGRLSVVAQIHAANNSTAELTLDDVLNVRAQEEVGAIQQAIAHYGPIDTALLDRMYERGPTYLHAVTNYEGNVIRWNNEKFGTRDNPWDKIVLIYPTDGMFWVDHPYCVLDNAPWATPEQLEGARQFRDFIIQPEQQEQLVSVGIRPALTDITLDVPDTPLTLENGVVPGITPEDIPVLPIPSADVIANVIEMWRTVKKPSSVVLVIDISGSMGGEPLERARVGAQEFVRQMQPNDEITVVVFNDRSIVLEPSGLVGEVGEQLINTIGNLGAGGGTALYASTIDAMNRINAIREEHIQENDRRIYGVVLMTDGQNSITTGPNEQSVLNILPDGRESDQVRLYTIAYGEGADQDLLRTVSERTNGRFFEGSLEDIEDIYLDISSEF